MSQSDYSVALSTFTSKLKSPFGNLRDDLSMLNREVKALGLPTQESNTSNNVSAEKQQTSRSKESTFSYVSRNKFAVNNNPKNHKRVDSMMNLVNIGLKGGN